MDSLSGLRPDYHVKQTFADASDHPILICLLGEFRVLKAGHPVRITSGSKTEMLLAGLALADGNCVLRSVLLTSLWPNSEPSLASQSLNSLVYSLHKLLGDEINGVSPVLATDGVYSLNVQAGVDVDMWIFDRLAKEGRRRAQAGDHSNAVGCYKRGIELYHGDLRTGTDVHAVIARERLRTLYLTMLAYLAEQHFAQYDYRACLDYALRLLGSDPFREDAHRLVMRCHVRLGQRAEALRQYRLCEDILRSEFQAAPEPSTHALFDLVRLDPGRV